MKRACLILVTRLLPANAFCEAGTSEWWGAAETKLRSLHLLIGRKLLNSQLVTRQ